MAYSPQTQQTTTKKGVIPNRTTVDQGLRAHMLKVFNWMGVALATSAIAAFLVASEPNIQQVFFETVLKDGKDVQELTGLGWLALLAPFGFILLLGSRLRQMSPAGAGGVLLGLSACMGIIMAPVVMQYTSASLAQTLFVTSGTFAVTSIYGYTTSADLTRFGNLLLMALFGLIIANITSIYMQSSAFTLLASMAGVIIFVAFTAYDAQRIKVEYLERGGAYGDAMETKFAIMDALQMYLNFLNLFLYLLRFMGVKSDD